MTAQRSRNEVFRVESCGPCHVDHYMSREVRSPNSHTQRTDVLNSKGNVASVSMICEVLFDLGLAFPCSSLILTPLVMCKLSRLGYAMHEPRTPFDQTQAKHNEKTFPIHPNSGVKHFPSHRSGCKGASLVMQVY